MKRTLLPLSLLLALLAASASAQDSPSKEIDPAEWVPADTLLYLGITDVERVWEDFKKTASYAMLNDKSLTEKAPEMGLFASAQEKLQERLAKALDVSKEQLRNPFRGPLALYALGDPAKPGELEPGLIATVGDAATMRKYYDAAVRKLKDVGKYETVNFGGDTIDVFTSRSEGDGAKKEDDQDPDFDAGESPLELLASGPDKAIERALDELFSAETMPPTLALCLTQDRLIVAGSIDQVKAALKRDKPGKSLAEADDYKALLRHLKPVGPVRLVCNVPRVIEMGKAAAKDDDEDLAKMLQVIGVDSLRSLVGHMRFGAAAYDSKFELLLLMKSERSGLAKILSMENRPTAPPASISADTVVFFGVNLQPMKLYEDIERMVRQTGAEAADQMRQALEAVPLPSGQPVNILKDFMDHLRGPLTMSLAFARPLNADAVRFVLSLGHKDQPAMTKFFSGFAGLLQPRDLRGTQVFDMPMFQMTLAATSDRLVLGNTAAVENALEAKSGDPLAESDAWKKLARLVPEQSWLTVYADSRKMMEAAIELAKTDVPMDASGLLSGLMSGLTGGTGDKDPEVMRKMLPYSAAGVMTITTTPEGVQFTSVTLKPEK